MKGDRLDWVRRICTGAWRFFLRRPLKKIVPEKDAWVTLGKKIPAHGAVVMEKKRQAVSGRLTQSSCFLLHTPSNPETIDRKIMHSAGMPIEEMIGSAAALEHQSIRRFHSGFFFREFSYWSDKGAVFNAHILQKGSNRKDHLLAIFPWEP